MPLITLNDLCFFIVLLVIFFFVQVRLLNRIHERIHIRFAKKYDFKVGKASFGLHPHVSIDLPDVITQETPKQLGIILVMPNFLIMLVWFMVFIFFIIGQFYYFHSFQLAVFNIGQLPTIPFLVWDIVHIFFEPPHSKFFNPFKLFRSHNLYEALQTFKQLQESVKQH
jgi:hypothetical protein